jgi:hypothetical protein
MELSDYLIYLTQNVAWLEPKPIRHGDVGWSLLTKT